MYVFIIRLTEKLSEDSQSRSLAKLLWLVQTWFLSAMSDYVYVWYKFLHQMSYSDSFCNVLLNHVKSLDQATGVKSQKKCIHQSGLMLLQNARKVVLFVCGQR